MADQSESSPSPERIPPSRAESAAGTARGGEPKRRHRAIVWSLIVLASLLLILSITANWVQTTLLDTGEVTSMTSEILADAAVQQQLSTNAVDQIYATVDVQGELEEQLPPPVKALAAPAGAAVRQRATDAAETALASPEVQDLISGAVGRAHHQFVGLIEDESEYVSSTDGQVTFAYGSVVADLAARLGIDPATISEVQGVVRDFSGDLERGLTTAQTQIESIRAGLSQAQEGEPSTEFQQGLQTLQANAAQLRGQIASLEEKISGVDEKVPPQLQSRLSDLAGRLSDLDDRLADLERRIAAVLEDPSRANLDALDASLASLQAQITTALERQVVQSPGELVVMSSTQLDAVQTLVRALRNLGIVLPLIVLLLYVAALYLAKGWRPRALIGAGGGILAATLLVLLVTRVIGSEVVASVAGSQTVEPAIRSVWDIVAEGLRERALFVLVIGLAFVGGGFLAGPGRHAVATRRFLAPSLRDNPVAVYSVVVALFLLWLAFIPGIDNLGQVLVILLLGALAVVGIEVLRRQTAQEFPPRPNSS